eukprot:19112-Heterococcus_DN1.PRE.3
MTSGSAQKRAATVNLCTATSCTCTNDVGAAALSSATSSCISIPVVCFTHSFAYSKQAVPVCRHRSTQPGMATAIYVHVHALTDITVCKQQ